MAILPKNFRQLRVLTILVSILALFLLNSKNPNQVFSDTADYIVISEVQIGGGTADDEFVELYNPTSTSVNLSGWRLTRKTSGGTQSNLVASISGNIASHGYFLIAHPDYDGSVAEDLVYSATSSAMAANNTVLLYSDAEVTLVDKVGMGTATDVETTATLNPSTDGSAERKAHSSSTSESMGSGGADETHGNGEDTNNNLNDFVTRTTSDPQNSLSTTETPPAETPTATLTPTETTTPTTEPTPTSEPTATLTPTLEPTSTEEPSPTLTPTIEPTVTESLTPTLTPTLEPSPTVEPTVTETVTPTEEPSPTSEPTPTVVVTPTLSPTPTPIEMVIGTFNFPGSKTVCTIQFRVVRFFFSFIFIPKINCHRL